MFRYRERLHALLEDERGQRRKSWKIGLSVLEEQQQQLLEAQQSATQALNEANTYVFIHRYLTERPCNVCLCLYPDVLSFHFLCDLQTHRNDSMQPAYVQI